MTPWVKAVRGIRLMFDRDSAAYRSIMCRRCNEIRYAPWQDLVLLWAPDRTPTEKNGEIIRRMALAEHAEWGHPTELEFHR